MSLFWRIFLPNASVLVVAALLLLGPVSVSTPTLLGEAVVVITGLVIMLIANVVTLRVGLAPLKRLTSAMSTADLLRPGLRPSVGGDNEMADLIATYNTMLDRLESERAISSARVLSAQEAERRRIARELHDEVGQTLTAVLLQLKHAAGQASDSLKGDLLQVQETTRSSLDEVRRIARRLRPGVLEDLGLQSALRALAAEFTTTELTVGHLFESGLPALDAEAELVIYRVAQEGLTNAARHSGASRAELSLQSRGEGRVELLVTDNGGGLRQVLEGAGIRGMRERALLIGADLHVGSRPTGGTEVRLDIPLGQSHPPRRLTDLPTLPVT
ncbi:HAMP domain-containing sensor histidine kinase [Streptomyces sp. NPDC006208]|uniref:HAMP domain-containing sensor histidine kinase n=1 Tax=Streptomyces sp. NPDC006208 TaxID=3156734 RepID=UPI0033A6C279